MSAERARTRRRRGHADARRRARRPRCARAARRPSCAPPPRRAPARAPRRSAPRSRPRRRRARRPPGEQRSRRRRARARGALEDRAALGQLGVELGLAGGDLALELPAPGGEAVDERLDLPLPAARVGHLEGAREAVDAERGVDTLERLGVPAPIAGAAVADERPQLVVAVEEDRRGDLDGVALARLRAIAAAVDHRLGVLDLDPRRAIARERDAVADRACADRRRASRSPSPRLIAHRSPPLG